MLSIFSDFVDIINIMDKTTAWQHIDHTPVRTISSASSSEFSTRMKQEVRPDEQKSLTIRDQPSRLPDPRTTSGQINLLLAFSVIPLLGIAVVITVSLLNTPTIKPVQSTGFTIEPGPDNSIRYILASYAGITESVFDEDRITLGSESGELFTWRSYTVQPGDTISGIAVSHNVSMDAIITSNNISNANQLNSGAAIRIPSIDGIPYTVKTGDTLSSIALTHKVPVEVLLDANNLSSEGVLPGALLFIPGARMSRDVFSAVLGENFIMPVKGKPSSSFGWRADPSRQNRQSYHTAVDWAAPTGTPVVAARTGTVTMVDTNATFGKFIIITHDTQYQTLYAHLNAVSVQTGTTVAQGSQIGEVGSTGYTTNSHLHFALYRNGNPVDPLEYIKQ
ncbi:hypothetical protein FACS1894172_06170 [Spirochaetia bacterium]|nr:hypothetical protein FACS1894172_06170 [Spirochaetia bacterium]